MYRLVVLLDNTQTADMLDMATGQVKYTLIGHTAPILRSTFSPDGRWLAYISRVGGAFKLHVMELAGGTVTQITDTTADESPSFAPNSRLIVYATQQQGREALMTTTIDGKIKARLAGASGDIREPDWGPFSR